MSAFLETNSPTPKFHSNISKSFKTLFSKALWHSFPAVLTYFVCLYNFDWKQGEISKSWWTLALLTNWAPSTYRIVNEIVLTKY